MRHYFFTRNVFGLVGAGLAGRLTCVIRLSGSLTGRPGVKAPQSKELSDLQACCTRIGARGRARWAPSRGRSSGRPCARSARSLGVPRAVAVPGGRVEAAGTLAARGGEVGGFLPLRDSWCWAWAAACGDGEPRGFAALEGARGISCRYRAAAVATALEAASAWIATVGDFSTRATTGRPSSSPRPTAPELKPPNPARLDSRRCWRGAAPP